MTYKERDNELSLWNEEDGFYYDAIQYGPGDSHQMAIRSLVGLIPLYATLTLEPTTINRFPGFKKRMEWFIDNRPEVSHRNMANIRSKFALFLPNFCALHSIISSTWERGEKTSSSGKQGTSDQASAACLG